MWSRAASRHDVLVKLEACSAAASEMGAQEERLMDITLRRFSRAGATLRDAAQRSRFTELRCALADAELTFEQHINEDVSTVHFSIEQLRGLPGDFVAGLPCTVPEGAAAACFCCCFSPNLSKCCDITPIHSCMNALSPGSFSHSFIAPVGSVCIRSNTAL